MEDIISAVKHLVIYNEKPQEVSKEEEEEGEISQEIKSVFQAASIGLHTEKARLLTSLLIFSAAYRVWLIVYYILIVQSIDCFKVMQLSVAIWTLNNRSWINSSNSFLLDSNDSLTDKVLEKSNEDSTVSKHSKEKPSKQFSLVEFITNAKEEALRDKALIRSLITITMLAEEFDWIGVMLLLPLFYCYVCLYRKDPMSLLIGNKLSTNHLIVIVSTISILLVVSTISSTNTIVTMLIILYIAYKAAISAFQQFSASLHNSLLALVYKQMSKIRSSEAKDKQEILNSIQCGIFYSNPIEKNSYFNDHLNQLISSISPVRTLKGSMNQPAWMSKFILNRKFTETPLNVQADCDNVKYNLCPNMLNTPLGQTLKDVNLSNVLVQEEVKCHKNADKRVINLGVYSIDSDDDALASRLFLIYKTPYRRVNRRNSNKEFSTRDLISISGNISLIKRRRESEIMSPFVCKRYNDRPKYARHRESGLSFLFPEVLHEDQQAEDYWNEHEKVSLHRKSFLNLNRKSLLDEKRTSILRNRDNSSNNLLKGKLLEPYARVESTLSPKKEPTKCDFEIKLHKVSESENPLGFDDSENKSNKSLSGSNQSEKDGDTPQPQETLVNAISNEFEDEDYQVNEAKVKQLQEKSECFIFIQEITDTIRHIEQQIESKYKNIIMSKLNHEIKTPCMAIGCFTGQIERDFAKILNDKRFNRLFRDTIKIQIMSEQILNVVCEMNEYIKGIPNVVVNMEEVQVSDILNWAYWLLYSLIETDKSKKVKPIISGLNDEFYIETDPMKLKIVLSELIKNAVKSTYKGQIEIRMDKDNDKFFIALEDTGRGMSEEKLDFLKYMFEALEDEMQRNDSALNGIDGCRQKPRKSVFSESKLVVSNYIKEMKERHLGVSKSPRQRKSFLMNVTHNEDIEKFALSGSLNLGLKIAKAFCLKLGLDIRLESKQRGMVVKLIFSELRRPYLKRKFSRTVNEEGNKSILPQLLSKKGTDIFKSPYICFKNITSKVGLGFTPCMKTLTDPKCSSANLDKKLQLTSARLRLQDQMISDEPKKKGKQSNVLKPYGRETPMTEKNLLSLARNLVKPIHLGTDNLPISRTRNKSESNALEDTVCLDNFAISKTKNLKYLIRKISEIPEQVPTREIPKNHLSRKKLEERPRSSLPASSKDDLDKFALEGSKQSKFLSVKTIGEIPGNSQPVAEEDRKCYPDCLKIVQDPKDSEKRLTNNYITGSFNRGRKEEKLSPITPALNILKKKTENSSNSHSSQEEQYPLIPEESFSPIENDKNFVIDVEDMPRYRHGSKLYLNQDSSEDSERPSQEIDPPKDKRSSFPKNSCKPSITAIPNSIRRDSTRSKRSFVSDKVDTIDRRQRRIENMKETTQVKKEKILIVDDDVYCSKILKKLTEQVLEKLGMKNYEVIKALDGLDTLNYIIQDEQDKDEIRMIISDENMNYINGSESFNIVNRLFMMNKISRKPAMLILTALEENEALAYIKSVSNADNVLKKPLNKVILEENIRRLILNKS